MHTGRVLVVTCSILGLVLAGCAPTSAPTPAPKATAPPPKAEAPAVKATATPPAPTPKPAGEQPGYGGILAVHANGTPPSFDIQQEATIYVIQPFATAYNSLVKYDPFKGEIVGDLAQKWEVSEGGQAYTFFLHSGVKWHDGKPFSSEDVKYSLDRIRMPAKGTVSPRQEALSAVKDVEIVDKDTVKVILKHPHAVFLSLLSTGWEVIMPKHVIEAKGGMKRDVVGTGPFKLVRHDSGMLTEMTKNTDYFVKGRPYLDGIKFFIIPDATTRFAALRTKRIHMTATANGLTPSQGEVVEKEKLSINILRTETKVWRVLMVMDTPPWNDVRVRRAVDLGVDRQAAVRIIAEGEGSVGPSLPTKNPLAIPEAEMSRMPGYRQPKDEDIAEAKKLLAEAGFPQGFEAKMEFRSGSTFEKGAVFFRDQLAKVGVRTTLQGGEAGAFMNRLYEGRAPLATVSHGITSSDPGFILGGFAATGGEQNYTRFTDKEFDAMFQEQMRTLDAAKRKELVLKMQRRILEIVPYVLSHWQADLMGLWPEVRNVKPGLTLYDNFQHENTWLAK